MLRWLSISSNWMSFTEVLQSLMMLELFEILISKEVQISFPLNCFQIFPVRWFLAKSMCNFVWNQWSSMKRLLLTWIILTQKKSNMCSFFFFSVYFICHCVTVSISDIVSIFLAFICCSCRIFFSAIAAMLKPTSSKAFWLSSSEFVFLSKAS